MESKSQGFRVSQTHTGAEQILISISILILILILAKSERRKIKIKIKIEIKNFLGTHTDNGTGKDLHDTRNLLLTNVLMTIHNSLAMNASLSSRSIVLSTGLAMFSMFFGAGNVVFPLVVGQVAGDQTFFALLGLLITAVGVPFLGLLAILLFQGNYETFFGRCGKIPGFLVAAAIMLLIGPFGGLPRCIALSYSTIQLSFPVFSFAVFSFLACILIFACTYKKSRMISVLGFFLTPLLLLSLAIVVLLGLWTGETSAASHLSAMQSFVHGFMEGYNTMDLLASFFFSAIIYRTLKQEIKAASPAEERQLFQISLKSSCIGAALLSLVYIGFSVVAARHATALEIVDQGELLGALTLKILGPYAGLVASSTIALACLTTAIALAAVFAEFLKETIFRNHLSYPLALILTLVAGYGVSLLEFNGIVTLLAPVLQVAYPALIIYTLFNIASRLKTLKLAENQPCIQK